MKMVIFGAGASFDSVYSYNYNLDEFKWRPPLGNEIFTTRKNFMGIFQNYPGVISLLSYLNAIDDIEDFFQKRYDFTQTYKPKEFIAELINIQFCLQHLFYSISHENFDIGLSNYDILVNQALEYAIAKKEDVLFVTFNYDLLLEFALKKKYFTFQQRDLKINEYLSTPIKIIKPHGSCNWFRRFNENPFREDYNFRYQIFNDKYDFEKIESMLDNDIEVVNNPGIANAFYFPQLLIPFKSKDSFIMPKEQKDYLDNNLHRVSEILIVGWKGTEYNFLNLLKEKLYEKPVKITCVNGSSNNIADHLKEYIPNSTTEYYTERFNLTTYDNSILSYRDDDKKNIIYHSEGTFSSYTLNTTKGRYKNFFEL
ncbi:MAG: hypothetical protein KGZ74_18270 [Chitinophagaceae bacterium]|nr:hypothetical protein [Chitinophagaceae bacterium]